MNSGLIESTSRTSSNSNEYTKTHRFLADINASKPCVCHPFAVSCSKDIQSLTLKNTKWQINFSSLRCFVRVLLLLSVEQNSCNIQRHSCTTQKNQLSRHGFVLSTANFNKIQILSTVLSEYHIVIS